MIYRETSRIRLTKLGGSLFTIGFSLASCCIAADPSTSQVIAQGGGTTIVQGGTGKAGGFIPVLTTIAFHAERSGTTITGGFECLARAPEKKTGSTSAQFTVNAMYVTGQIKNAVVQGTTATLTGTADITGLGVGSNIPFTLVVRQGGPGTTAVLTTEGTPQLIFNEILVEGDFRVFSGESNGN
jgi:hypothetical protein